MKKKFKILLILIVCFTLIQNTKVQAATVNLPTIADFHTTYWYGPRNYSYLKIGDESDNNITVYIRFNKSLIPAGATITSAKLYTFLYDVNEYIDGTINAGTGTTLWDDTNPTGYGSTSEYGGETKRLQYTSENNWIAWEATDIVKYWMDNNTNASIAINTGGGHVNGAAFIASSEYSDSSKRPYMQVIYDVKPTATINQPTEGLWFN